MDNNVKEKYPLSSDQKKRLNILKLILAVFVVYVHSNIVKTSNFSYEMNIPRWLDIIRHSFSSIICMAANNCFFFLAAFFLYRKDFKWTDNIKKKIKSLVIPYFIINLLTILICFFFASFPLTSSFFTEKYKVNNFHLTDWLKAFGLYGHFPIYGPSWFIRNLFILNIFAITIKKIIDKFPKTFFIVLLVTTIMGIYNSYEYLSNLLFWCLGYYTIKCNIDIELFRNKMIYLFLYILTILSLIILYIFNITLPTYLSNAFSIINTLLCLIVLYTYCTHYKGKINHRLEKISSYSICIFLFHYLPVRFSLRFLIKISSVPFIILIEYLFVPMIIIILIILVCIVWNKYSPKSFNLITGSRINKPLL